MLVWCNNYIVIELRWTLSEIFEASKNGGVCPNQDKDAGNDTLNIMIIGVTGAGKSYFVNALLGCQTPNKCGGSSKRFPVPGTDCYKDCSGYAAVAGNFV